MIQYNIKVAELSSAIGLKANSSELMDFYNKLTTNSLLESYYNKTYTETRIKKEKLQNKKLNNKIIEKPQKVNKQK